MSKIEELKAKAKQPKQARVIDDRLTLRGECQHQHPGNKTHECHASTHIWLEQAVEPFEKTVNATQTYAVLNTYWLERVGYVFIKNLAGTTQQARPTQEELDEINKQVLYVRIVGNEKPIMVRPGAYASFELCEGDKIEMMSPVDLVAQVTAFPK